MMTQDSNVTDYELKEELLTALRIEDEQWLLENIFNDNWLNSPYLLQNRYLIWTNVIVALSGRNEYNIEKKLYFLRILKHLARSEEKFVDLPVLEGGKTYLTDICQNKALNDNALDVLKVFISAGANINAIDRNGETPLMVTCYDMDGNYTNNRVTLVKTLLELGADPRLVDKFGYSPIHAVAMSQPFIALQYENNERNIIKMLVANGANVNRATTILKDTPLHTACRRHASVRRVKLLLELGADATALNALGETPLFASTTRYVATDLQTKKIEEYRFLEHSIFSKLIPTNVLRFGGLLSQTQLENIIYDRLTDVNKEDYSDQKKSLEKLLEETAKHITKKHLDELSNKHSFNVAYLKKCFDELEILKTRVIFKRIPLTAYDIITKSFFDIMDEVTKIERPEKIIEMILSGTKFINVISPIYGATITEKCEIIFRWQDEYRRSRKEHLPKPCDTVTINQLIKFVPSQTKRILCSFTNDIKDRLRITAASYPYLGYFILLQNANGNNNSGFDQKFKNYSGDRFM